MTFFRFKYTTSPARFGHSYSSEGYFLNREVFLEKLRQWSLPPEVFTHHESPEQKAENDAAVPMLYAHATGDFDGVFAWVGGGNHQHECVLPDTGRIVPSVIVPAPRTCPGWGNAEGAPADPAHLSPAEKDTLRRLRSRGFAVVVFNPAELSGVSAGDMEESLIITGNEIISDAYPNAK